MSDLTDFLLVRIAEDEEQARALTRWPTFEMPFHRLYDDDPEVQADFDAKDHAKTLARLLATHGIPARVLAECEAKRQIVAEHPLTTDVVPVMSGPTPGYACDRCARLDQVHDDSIVEDQGACNTLRALAAVYADHPDYRQEWKEADTHAGLSGPCAS